MNTIVHTNKFCKKGLRRNHYFYADITKTKIKEKNTKEKSKS